MQVSPSTSAALRAQRETQVNVLTPLSRQAFIAWNAARPT